MLSVDVMARELRCPSDISLAKAGVSLTILLFAPTGFTWTVTTGVI